MKLAPLISSAVALAASVATVTAGLGPAVPAQAAASKPAVAGACRHIAGPFRRVRNTITGALAGSGTPHGITAPVEGVIPAGNSTAPVTTPRSTPRPPRGARTPSACRSSSSA